MINKKYVNNYEMRFAGSLSPELEISEIIQLAGQNKKCGLLTIFGEEGNALIYFDKGKIVHSSYSDLKGIDVLVEMLSWKDSRFMFEEGMTSEDVNIGSDYNSALLKAFQRYDERNRFEDVDLSPNALEEKSMVSLREQLEDFLQVEGITTVVVVGRDGFIIDSASTGCFNIDEVGAVVSTGMRSFESMGAELGVGDMQQGMLVYDDSIVFINALGEDAIFVLVGRPEVNLGMVRLRIKRRIDDIKAAMRK
jgi:predicted regulator of Ras-like GTPase activity (Roadblock/LC7/MglB family)